MRQPGGRLPSRDNAQQGSSLFLLAFANTNDDLMRSMRTPTNLAMMRPLMPRLMHTPMCPRLAIMPRMLSTKTLGTMGDHSWRQQNHIWSEAEVQQRMTTAETKHVPQTAAEALLQKVVRAAYHTFNFATGYDHADPPTSAIGYRCGKDARPGLPARTPACKLT